LQRRETRLKRIREAKRALEERAREKAKKEDKPVEKAWPEAKDQYNFTDPESRMMKSSSDGFVQAYNAQIVVEPEPRRPIEAFIATERPKQGERGVCARGPWSSGI
jgi:hypothetical protein